MVNFHISKSPTKLIGYHSKVPEGDQKTSVSLIIPRHLPTNAENLVKISLVLFDISVM